MKKAVLLAAALICGWAAPVRADFDHSAFNKVLSTYVHHGQVDYVGLKAKGSAGLDKYLADLATADPATLKNDDERTAFWVNAYNACSLKAVLEGGNNQNRAGRHRFFSELKFNVAKHDMTLDDMENKYMGDLFHQPLVHFGLVCSSVGSPPLRSEAYTGENVTKDLEDNARTFVADPTRVRWDEGHKVLWLSPVFDWYKADFTAEKGDSVLGFIREHASASESLPDGAPDVQYFDYDWSLNGN
ncbi:MAG TPA: DUF547 domain-containing protein [Candidatus Xenobia bacterium]|jgi:hypothetical protein